MTTAAHVEHQRASRYANERLGESLLVAHVAGDRIVPFLCECADLDCRGRVEMTMADYDTAHLDRLSFVVLKAHPLVAGEEVVEENDGYDLVRKGAA